MAANASESERTKETEVNKQTEIITVIEDWKQANRISDRISFVFVLPLPLPLPLVLLLPLLLLRRFFCPFLVSSYRKSHIELSWLHDCGSQTCAEILFPRFSCCVLKSKRKFICAKDGKSAKFPQTITVRFHILKFFVVIFSCVHGNLDWNFGTEISERKNGPQIWSEL